MANESSSNDSSNGTTASPADSYIGSFISLTSKYEIRYEGILYHLNPQDSTLGLKSVRSYGTEGRKKDGPQVPPSDKVYEYILFRGSDIKDLQVKASRPAEVQEPLQSDPAIIQSKYAAGPSNLSKPVSDASGSIVEASSYNEPLALNTSSDLSRSPPNPSGIQMGLRGPSQATRSFGMTPYDLRTHWQGYNGSAGTTPYAQQHSVSSARIPYPVQNLLEASGSLAPTTMAATNVYDNVSLSPSFAASNSIYSNFKPTLTSLHPTSPTNSLSSLPLESSLPSHQTAGLNSNRLTMPSFSLAPQHVSNMEASLSYNVVPEPVTLLPIQGSLPSTSFVLDSTSDPLLKQTPALVTPNQLSQPRLSEISQMPKIYPDQKGVRIMGSISLNSLSSVTTPAVQPLLPLPPSAQQSQYLSQFTEEFDFEAMNERFKKDEVWGYLGKVNNRDNIEGIQHNLLYDQNPGGEDHSGLVSTGDSKPAYNKDDFFDTISCNRINHGARNRYNQFSERTKQDTETFGNFQQRTHSGYSGGYAGRHGDYHGSYNWGREYYHSGQGRGGYTRR